MARVIDNNPIVKTVTVVKDGECNVNISLDLTIHVDNDITTVTQGKKEENTVDWAVPDFTSNNLKLRK